MQGHICRGMYDLYVKGGSQVVMDDQGGPRAGDQVFALRQLAEMTIEKALVTYTHFSVFYKVNSRVKSCYIFAEELLICNIANFIKVLRLTLWLFLFVSVFAHVHHWITQYLYPTRMLRYIIM